jgi:hypothetical protein
LCGCIGLEEETAHEDQVRADLIHRCAAADQRFMEAVKDVSIPPDEMMARQQAARACWNDVGLVDQTQVRESERRLQMLEALSRPQSQPTFTPQNPSSMPMPSMPTSAPPIKIPDYVPKPIPHGCIGQVPVSGPGFNPCPGP